MRISKAQVTFPYLFLLLSSRITVDVKPEMDYIKKDLKRHTWPLIAGFLVVFFMQHPVAPAIGKGKDPNLSIFNTFVLADPVLNQATGIGQTGFTVTWASVVDATDYLLDVSTDNFSSFVSPFQDFATGDVVSFDVTGLSPGTAYQCRLRASNFSENSGYSNVITVSTFATEPADAPADLIFSSVTTSSFNVSFTAATGSPSYLALRRAGTAPTETPVDGTGYTVGSTFGSSTIAYSGSTTGFSESSLTAGTTYHYAIFSFNGSGSTANYLTTSSLTGSQITLTDAPVLNAPTSITQTSATQTWSAVTGASDYRLDVSADNFSTYVSGYQNQLTGNVTSVSITGLTAGTTYSIRLRAVNAAGSSSNSNTQTVLTIPPTPTGLGTSAITSSGFTLSWTAVASSTNFFVDLSIDNFSTLVSSNLSVPGPTSYSFTGLSSGTTYQARLRSANATGSSPNSSTASASTFAAEPVDAPSGLSFGPITTSSFNVSFTAATGSPSYLALRRAGTAPTETPVDGTDYAAGSTFGSSTIAYIGSTTGFSESSLTAGTTYHYTIFSFNGSGSTANYLTTSSLSGSQITLSDAPVLNAPTSITQTSATQSWSAVTGASDYRLDVSADNFSTYVSGYQNQLTGNVTSVSITGLTAGTTYSIRLRVVNAAGSSANSNTQTVLTIPPTPTGLTTSAVTASGFTLSWTAVASATNFFVDLSIDNFSTFVSSNLSVPGPTSYSFTGLSSGTTYQARLRSANATGSSPNSSTASASTFAAEPVDAPSGLSFGPITTSSFNVSFTAATGSPSYLALRRGGTAPTETPVDGTGYSTGSTFGSSTIAYNGSSTSFSESSLTAGTTYHYTIFSFNGSGSTANYLTTSSLTGSQITLSDAPVLNAPTSITQTSATQSWSAVTGASDYRLDVSADNFSTYVSGYQNQLTGNVTSVSITGLTAGTTYSIRLRAVNATGSSANSNVQTAMTIPPTPTGLATSAITSSGFTLSWTSVASATNFFVDLSIDNFSTLVSSNLSVPGPTSYSFTGLSSGTTYQARLRSANATGSSPSSAAASASTFAAEPVDAPSGLSFGSITTSSFNVSFTAATGSPSYLALRRAGTAPTETPVDGTDYTGGSTFGSSTIAYNGSSTSFSESSLTAGTTYHYAIFSFNGSGSTANYLTTSSLTGSQITLTNAPVLNTPTSITQTSATQSWSAVTGASDYRLDVSADNFSTYVSGYQNQLTGNVTSVSITGLTAGTTYSIRLRAVNAAGSSANSNTQTVLTIPPTPTGLATSAITSSGFTLSWTAVASATNFFVDLSTDNFSTFVSNNLSVPGPTSYSFTGLSSGTTYQARLRSANATGSSPNSSTASTTTLQAEPVSQPTSLVFTSISATGLTVSFTAATNNPNYFVLRRAGSSPTETPVDGVGYTMGNTFGSSTIAYIGSAISFNESSLSAATTYFYSVFSFNGSGSLTNYLVTSPLTGSQITLTNAPVLNTPTSITQTSATQSWSAVTGASDYRLDVSADNFSTYVSGYQNQLTGNVTSVSITGLTAGTTYSIRMRAVNAAGSSANSNVQTVLTIPPTPTGLGTSAITSSGFTLSWTSVASATNFFVDLSTDNFSTIVSNNLSVPGPTSYSFTGLSSGTTYEARLRSANATGSSPNSSTATATTLLAEPVSQPTSLVFTSISATGLTVSFTAATNNPNYFVLRRAGSSPTETPVDGTAYTMGNAFGSSTIAYIGSATSFNESALASATTYFYAVFSFNGSGSLTNYLVTSPLAGSQITLTTAPVLGAPTLLTQTSGTISWPTVTGATDYALDVSTNNFSGFVSGFQNKLLGNINTFAITGLTPATQYQIRLRAINAGGSSVNSNVIGLLTIPVTPSGLVASAISPTGFTLSWNAVTGFDNFFIDLSTDGFSTFVMNNAVVAGPTSHTFTGLASATTFQVMLRSGNASGASPNSSVVQVTTFATEPAAQPTNLSFNSITTSSLNVLFTAASGSPNYLVLRKAGSAPTEFPIDGVTYVSGSSMGASFIAFIGGTAGFSESGLIAGTTYYYTVFSFNGNAATANFLTASALTGSQVTRCNAPTVNNATSITQTSATVSWNAVTGASDYGLDVSTDNFANFVSGFQNNLLGNVTSYSITNLIAGTQYQIRLRAINAAGSSVNSNVVLLLTIPATPSGLVASGITTSGFTLSWNAISGFDHFNIDISPDNFTTYTYNNVSIPGPATFIISGLASGTSFKVRLRSANLSGVSPNSSVLTVTTENVLEPLTMHIPVFQSEMRTSPVVVTVEVSGGFDPRAVTLHYKGIAAVDFLSSDIVLKAGTSSVYESPITAALADELGVEFYISSKDASNVAVETPNHYFIYRAFDATANLAIPFNTSAFNGKPETFQMYSVPYNLTDQSVAGLFENVLGASGKNSWRLFHFQNNKYDEHPVDFNQIELGKGYWFNTLKKNFQIKIGDASVFQATTTQSFQMTLEQGWNQIGDPYPFNVDWDQIKSANSAAGLNSFYGFESGAYIKKNVLGAWKAGFVFSDNGGVVSFPVTSKTLSGGRMQSPLGSDIDEEAWLLPITLEAGGWLSESGIGMHPDSKTTKDRFDEITMPRFIQYLEMSTTHPEFFAPDFSTDVVPTASTYHWDFRLGTNVNASNGNLSWDISTLNGASSTLLLLDEANQALVNMKTVGNYSFGIQNGQAFRVMFMKDGDFKPGITALGTAYPNPFSQSITIPVYLTQENSEVQVNIFDGLGRMVRSLDNNFADAGYYEINWDGMKSSQSPADDGLLYYRTMVNGKPGSLKRLIKLSHP